MTDETGAREGSDELAREAFHAEGSEVVVTRQGDVEKLFIDGNHVGFHVTDGRYVLKADAYRPPAKSLRQAVERYLKSEAER